MTSLYVHAGICAAERITCLVVDECHRATGKADIVLAVKRMRDAGVKFRVLGLSATPGRDRESVQVCVSCSAFRWSILRSPYTGVPTKTRPIMPICIAAKGANLAGWGLTAAAGAHHSSLTLSHH